MGVLDRIQAEHQRITAQNNTLADMQLQKANSLAKYHDSIAEEVRRSKEESLTGRMGIDPNASPLLHTVVNGTANVVSGVGRVVGDLAEGAYEAFKKGNAPLVGDDVRAAYNRELQGTATEADRALLGAYAGNPEPDQPGLENTNTNLRTNRDVLKNWVETAQGVAAIDKATDFSGLKDNRDSLIATHQLKMSLLGAQDKNQFADALRQAGNTDLASDYAWSAKTDVLQGMWDFGTENKGVVLDSVLENAPQLAAGIVAGPAGTAAVTAGYANDIKNKAILAYMEKNNGQVPLQEELNHIMSRAAAANGLEFLSDRLTLGAGKLVSGAASQASKAVASMEKGAFKSLLSGAGTVVNNPATRMVGSTGLAGAGEYGTEFAQTYLENDAERKESTLEELHTAGTLGMWSGAAMNGAVETLPTAVEIAQATAKTVRQLNSKEAPAQSQVTEQIKKDFSAAIEAKDASVFTDPKQPTFNPEAGISVLHNLATAEGVTAKERQSYLEQAKAVAELAQQRVAAATGGGETALQADIASVQEALKTIDPTSGPEAQAQHEDLTMELELLQEQYTAQQNKANDPEAQARIKALTEQAERANAAYENLAQMVVGKDLADVDVDSVVAAVDTPVDTNNAESLAKGQEAANKLQILAMASPSSVSPQVARQLAGNTQNALQAEQRDFLVKHADAVEAQEQLKSLKKVNNEVLFGDPKLNQMGMVTYQERMGKFLAQGDKTRAEKLMMGLTNFLASHQQKAEALQTAYQEYKRTGQAQAVIKNKDTGTWEVSPTTGKSAEISKGGNYFVSNFSGALVKAVTQEAAAIAKTQAALESATALAFKTTATPADTATNTAPTATTTETGVNNDNTTVQPSTSAQPTVQTSTVSQPVSTDAVVQSSPTVAPTATTETSSTTTVTPTTEPAVNEIPASTPTVPAQTIETTTPTTPVEAATEVATPSITDAGTDAGVSTEGSTDTLVEDTGVVEPTVEQITALKDSAVGQWIKQTAGNKDTGTQRPLASVKNFISSWLSGKTEQSPADFLDQAPSDPQNKAIYFLAARLNDWGKTLTKTLNRGQLESKFAKNPAAYLMEATEKGLDLEENVKTAMIAAAMTWVADTHAKGNYNDKEAINSILGKPEGTKLVPGAYKALAKAGVRHATAANALGKRIVQALGIQPAKGAPANLIPNLEAALGTYALNMLHKEGLVEVTTISDADFQRYAGRTSDNARRQHYFVRLSESQRNKDKVKEVVDVQRGTQNVLDKLFSIESFNMAPTLEPVKFNQKKAKGSKQAVPRWIAKILNKKNQEENRVREDTFDLLNGMSDELVVDMAGGLPEGELQHISQVKGNQAKRDGLAREWANFKEFVESHLKQDMSQPFFFQHVLWKNQRVGILNNLVNPQTSKIHRGLVTRPTWKTTVDRNNPQQMVNFKLRVLEGLGVKTDKQNNQKSLAEWDAKVKDNEVIQAAVKAIQAKQSGLDLTSDQQLAIVKAVKQGGEKFHSLDALMALAAYQQSTNGTFTTYLTGEVDGVTNGPMLTHMLLGAAYSVGSLFGLVNKGGFFQEGSGHQNYNVYRGSEGVMDLYETVASEMVKDLRPLIGLNPVVDAQLGALEHFTGSLEKDGKIVKAGRNIVKKPLTALMFGSGLDNVISDMASTFVESIYDVMVSTSTDPAQRQKTIEQLNQLLGKDLAWPTDMTQEALLNREFTPKEQKAIEAVFTQHHGTAVKQALERTFPKLLDQRDTFNSAARTAFGLYDVAYQVTKQKFVEHLKNKGELDTSGDWDLNAEQKAELEKVLKNVSPVLSSIMALYSNSRDAGLSVSKTENELSQNPLYSSTAEFNGKGFTDSFSTTTHSQERVMKDPGVAMLVTSIHSTDSFISHMAAMLTEALNIHDAHVSGLNDFDKVARNLNQATWTALLNYSPANELYVALERTTQGLLDLLDDVNTDPALAGALINHLKAEAQKEAKNKKSDFQGGTPAQYLTWKLQQAKELAYDADKVRLEALSQMQSIDQYALEGAQYDVTDADRQAALDKLNNLKGEVDPKLLERVAALDNIKETQAAAAPTVEVTGQAEVAQEVQEQAQDAASEVLTEKVGPVGPSMVASESDVQAMVEGLKPHEGQSQITAHQLLGGLRQVLKGRKQTPYTKLYSTLLEQVKKALSTDVKVVYVTTMTDPALVSKPPTASRGWFDPDNKTVYLLAPAFAASGLTAETVLHEVLHAAISHVLHSPVNAIERQLLASMESLLEQVRSYTQTEGITGYENALQDVHELLSWGLFNKEFQRDVLTKVYVKDNTYKHAVSALKAFLDKIVGFLFRKTPVVNQDDQVIALMALMNNAYKLMNNAKQTKATQNQKGVIRPMATSVGQQVHEFTTQQVFDALGQQGSSVSLAFQEKLQGVLDTVVSNLHGPLGAIKARIAAQVGATPLDAWAHALSNNQRLFAGKVLSANIAFNGQEAYVAEQVEATVTAVLEDKSAAGNKYYAQLEKLFAEAKDRLKGQIDPDLYKFVFYPQAGMGGKSDYLSRFVALGLSNEQFNQALAFETRQADTTLQGKNFVQKLETLFRAMMDWIGAKMTGVRLGDQANQRLEHLVTQLVQIEVRHKNKIQGTSVLDFFDPLSDKAGDIADATRSTISKAANSNLVRNSGIGLVRTAGVVANIATAGNAADIISAVQKLRAQVTQERPGTAMGLLNYMKGVPQWMNEMLRETKRLEGARLHVSTDTAKAVLNGFKDNGEYLEESDKAAITAVLLRSGAHVLLDTLGLSGLSEVLSNNKLLQGAIDQEVTSLNHLPEVHYYVAQAKGLAWLKVSGRVGKEQMLNAHNIAKLYNTGKAEPKTADQAIPAIERLIALYSLAYAQPDHKVAVADVMRTEAQRGDKNGVHEVLKLAKWLEEDAKTRLFSGTEALRMHGWMPEVLNPHVTFDVARDEAEAQALKEQGYVAVGSIPRDPADLDQRPATMYKLVGGGMNRRVSGTVSFTGNQAKGNTKHPEGYHPLSPSGMANQISMNHTHASNSAAVDEMFKPNPGFDPRADKSNYMVPLLDRNGNKKDYRYMMKESVRDEHMERDNRFEHLLGVYAAATFDKVESRKQNKEVVKAMYEHYRNSPFKGPEFFAHVHHSSSDPEMREIWKLIPEATRKDIEQVWGKNGMYVPYDMLDVTFGYRKGSLGDMYDKEVPREVEKMIMSLLASSLKQYGKLVKGLDDQDAVTFSKQGQVVIRRAEQGWQELVKIIKDTIVVKTLVVLRDNVISNTMFLAMKGVPVVDALKHTKVALKGAMDYERDRSALAQLQLQMAVWDGVSPMDEVQAEIVRLEDAINRNPVKELIDAGLMPTIVEDISMEDDPYSYRSKWAEWADQKTNWVNPQIKKVASMGLLTHETGVYKFLSKATQYSDFTARYALYQHLTTRKRNPLSKADAMYEASESFVNYDLPLPKWVQYADDMYLVPFLKYKLSMQRVLYRTFKENPLQVLSTMALGNWMGNMPLPTDSSLLNGIGSNRLQMGILELPSALNELATVQAGMALIK